MQRLEVQLIRCIKVSTYGFRVVVHDNSFISKFLDGPYALHAAVVELDTLSDPDRTGTDNQDLLLVARLTLSSSSS